MGIEKLHYRLIRYGVIPCLVIMLIDKTSILLVVLLLWNFYEMEKSKKRLNKEEEEA